MEVWEISGDDLNDCAAHLQTYYDQDNADESIVVENGNCWKEEDDQCYDEHAKVKL